jgi:two-component system, LuxR family, sensor kinase FixL
VSITPRPANGPPGGAPPAPPGSGEAPARPAADWAAVERLQTGQEELRVTEEELRTQNEELQAARQEVEAQRERYRALFEFAPDAYLVTTPEGKILEANRAAAELLHVQPQFLVGKPLAVFVPEEERREFRERLNRLSAGEPRQDWEGHLAPRHGTTFQAALTVGAERDARGGVVGLRWLLWDITARKQADRLATIGEMVAGLAHESRNALQRSEACLERLRFRLTEQPEALDLVRRVQKAHDDLRRLFEDVRVYAGPVQLEREVCDLAEVWREAWAQLAIRREGRDVTLGEDSGDTGLECLVDRFRLQQVFWNVFDNALAACPDPVRIVVRCATTTLAGKRALRLAVRDNGPGLTAEQGRKIFEPFFTTKVKGTGLGMAIAKRIVEAHGGGVAVGECDPPGAEILITLPVRKP